MSDRTRVSRAGNQSDVTAADPVDLLLNRLVDSEASDADRRKFETLAASDPMLWRELAERQLESAALSSAVEARVQRATRIELPVRQQRGGLSAPGRRSHIGTWRSWSGWAVAAVLLIWIGLLSFTPPDRAEERPVPQPAHAVRDDPAQLEAYEWLLIYLDAPYVLGELDPVLLHTRELDDGRIELRFIRRIEETLQIESDEAIPRDEHGRLKLDPARLRKATNRGG